MLGTQRKTSMGLCLQQAHRRVPGAGLLEGAKAPVIIVRLFNTVGPRQTGQYGMVIPTFVRQALAGQPITVFGDGTQSRSFTYVGDVVRAMVALVNEPAAVGHVFNIGHGAEIAINQLAEKVKALTSSPSKSSTFRTTGLTSRDSRTCRAGCPTAPSSSP